MKNLRIASIIFLMSVVTTAHCQIDTITPCQRYERYLYDSLWADNFSQNCDGYCDLRGTEWRFSYNDLPAIVLRPCHTDTMITVTGVAAPLMELCSPEIYSNRPPEYFYLYRRDDTGFVMLASARWDTAVPNKVMQMYGMGRQGGFSGFGEGYHSYDTTYASYISSHRVYEAYFDKPVQISGDFYVGGSIHEGICPTLLQPLTIYIRWTYPDLRGKCGHNIPYSVWTDLIRYYGELHPTGTFVRNGLLWPGFSCIFPILRLPGDSIPSLPDTCYGTTGLRLLDVSGRNATLTWDDDGSVSRWEMALVKGDTATATPENGIVNSYNSNLAQLFYLDTASYTAYVRSVCDADRGVHSQWSDPVHFVIPQPDTTVNNIEPTLAERYTIVSPNPADKSIEVFSSFTIKQIDIVAADGRTLLSQEFSTNSATINLSAMPAGTLFVRVCTETGTVTKKIVKK